MSDEKQATKAEEIDGPWPLILDFIGPFVVHLHRDITVNPPTCTARIYAPQCPDHHANLLTDSNDVTLEPDVAADGTCSNNSYHFESKTAPAGTASYEFARSKQLLLISADIGPTDPKPYHIVLEVPFPNKIVPLIPEAIWIHRNKANTFVYNPDPDDDKSGHIVNSNRARGLRFVYLHCQGRPILKAVPQPALLVDLAGVKPEALGFKHLFPHYHMTVRFASATASSDEHHEDAYNCFENLRTMLNSAKTPDGNDLGISSWRVDFAPAEFASDEPSLLNYTGKKPVDCGASVVVVQDTAITARMFKSH